MENHSLLEKRIVVDDADVYNDGRYLVAYRRHGTQMASLIIHGDMSNAGQVLDTPLLSVASDLQSDAKYYKDF